MIAPTIDVLIAVRRVLMQDACTISRPAAGGDTPVLDGDGRPVPVAGSQVYAGPCVISDPTASQSAALGAPTDQAGVPNARVLKLPVDSAEVRPGDLVTVTASRFSPGLVGDRFLVHSEQERSYATSRRYTLRGSSL